METTDVYVVLNCWWRDGATVIGCGATEADAKAIAERSGRRELALDIGSWESWKPRDADSTGHPHGWSRNALESDGSVHPTLYQEIVRVPLAGGALPWDNPARDVLTDVQEAARRAERDYISRGYSGLR